jgi:hypothetical protein
MRLVAGIDRILFSEALAAEGAVVFAKACEVGLRGSCRNEPTASTGAGRTAPGSRPEPEFRQDVTARLFRRRRGGWLRLQPRLLHRILDRRAAPGSHEPP